MDEACGHLDIEGLPARLNKVRAKIIWAIRKFHAKVDKHEGVIDGCRRRENKLTLGQE